MRRWPELAACTEHDHVTCRDVAIRPNRKRRADRTILIDPLLVGDQIQRQRPIVGDSAIRGFELHHFESGGANKLLRGAVETR